LAGIPSGSSGEQKNVLNESDKIVNDQKEVANHFNIFFSTVAENIGKDKNIAFVFCIQLF
jgi:hypothetical protein